MSFTIREVARGLLFPEGPVALSDGSVLLVEIARGTLTRVRQNGQTQVIANLGGGPNGAAIGPDGAVYVCNNGGFKWHTEPQGWLRPIAQADDYRGGWIERVNLATGKSERVYERASRPLCGPNDLVFATHGDFYFTDMGKTRASDLDFGAVYRAHINGRAISAITDRAMNPNGIGLSANERTLYYAETEGARLWAFPLRADGGIDTAQAVGWPQSPHGAKMLTASPDGVYQRFDSLALDEHGRILVATLLRGGITEIEPDGRINRFIPLPEPMPTNLCFGGADGRTVFVTLSATGQLIAIDNWPCRGLPLAFTL